jgi:hypothetical protein
MRVLEEVLADLLTSMGYPVRSGDAGFVIRLQPGAVPKQRSLGSGSGSSAGGDGDHRVQLTGLGCKQTQPPAPPPKVIETQVVQWRRS